MRKKVCIDLSKLNNLYDGLGQVSYNFAEILSEIEDSELAWLFFLPHHFKDRYKSIKKKYILPQSRFFVPFSRDCDLWHALHQDSPYLPHRKCPYLLTIHDMNFLFEKSDSKVQARLKRLQKKVDRACYITVISKYTEKCIRAHLEIPDHKPVSVIYNGFTPPDFTNPQRPKFLPQGEFFFSIGVIKEKKNFHVLIDMMTKFRDYNLVIAGDDSHDYANFIKEKIRRCGLENRIVLPGKISEHDKAYLYKHCTAFLFPSKLEGFGLPVIEAFSYGKPVFLSTFTSLPEIGKHFAFYWYDFDPENMKKAVLKQLSEFYKEGSLAAKKEQEYAHAFSWTKNVKRYIDVYKSILRC